MFFLNKSSTGFPAMLIMKTFLYSTFPCACLCVVMFLTQVKFSPKIGGQVAAELLLLGFSYHLFQGICCDLEGLDLCSWEVFH